MNIKINKAYKDFIHSKNRYFICYGGAGSGKSFTVAQKLLLRIISTPNHRILVVRKVAATLRVSVFQLFRDLIDMYDLDSDFKINKSDMSITFRNGSQLLFFGLDNVEKLKSIQGITSIWIEEASEILEADFNQLNARLRNPNIDYQQIVLSFNPISINHWLKKTFFDEEFEDSKIIHTTYLDNKYIDSEYHKVLESYKKNNPEFYNIYCLGQWGVFKGLIYTKYEVVDELPIKYHDECLGIDFGYEHPQTMVHIRVIENDVYVKELFCKSGYTNASFAQHIVDNYSDLLHLPCYCDSARPEFIEELTSYGFNATKAKKSVFEGINFVKSKNLFITRDSKNLINELSTYVWREDKDGKTTDEPIKINDDVVDAMRYAIFSHLGNYGVNRSTQLGFL